MPSPALLLCLDLQPSFLNVMADGTRILRRCRFAVETAQGLGLPLLFTEQAPAKLGPTAPELLALVAKPVVLAKDEFSALANAPIQEAVRASGAKHLFLCGVETSVCVFQTARDAIESDFSVTLLADAVGARRPGDAAAALEHLARLGTHVLPGETVFYSLLRSSRHPFFREYTLLVKKYG